MDRAFWQPDDELRSRASSTAGTISKEDVARLFLTDSPVEEAVDRVRRPALERFGLTYGPPPPPPKRWWFLGERDA